MTEIIITCLVDGSFPRAWRREWVTPVPKLKPGEELKTCDDVRKVASTSDYSKVFETFWRDWITEDIGEKIDINQFAGKKGVGTEHMLVAMMDRILGQLDQVGMRAVIIGLVKRVKRTCSLSKELDHKAVSNNFQEKNFLSSSFSSFSFNCYSIQHRKTNVKKVLPSPKVLQNFPPEKNHRRTERTIKKAKKCYQMCHYNAD